MLYTPFKTAQDFECLIHMGEFPETIHWDYKQTFNSEKSKDIAIDLAAFANTFGGTLLIGVTEKSDGAKKVASGFVPGINVEEIKKNRPVTICDHRKYREFTRSSQQISPTRIHRARCCYAFGCFA